MIRKGYELWLALVAIVFIGMAYLFVTVIQGGLPEAGSFFGQALGGLGFLLMIGTETLYSLRKRSHSARWGRVAAWFQLHIFTGLVGPFLVLLHTDWKFHGLPGVLTVMMLVVTLSGFAGRYIYSAIPRTADGVVVEAGEIERQIATVQAHLTAWQPVPGNPAVQQRSRQLKALSHQRDRLRSQLRSLAATRRLLGFWFIFHIPISLGMFLLALIHIFTAVYFSSLAR